MDIKILYVNSEGVYQEHSEAADSIKVNSLKTANHELTDSKLGKLVGGADAADEHIHDARYYTKAQTDSAVSSEASARSSADSALDGRLDILEADPTTKSYVDGQISSEQSARQSADNALDGRLDILEADPVTKSYVDTQDSSKLQAAKDYADQKISALINGAPAMLDTLKEIADQLANDESAVTALTTTVASNLTEAKSYADGKVATEKSERESADNALDGRLDILEADPTTKTYVDGQISAEQSARSSADSALDGRLDILEADPVTKTYVDGKVSTINSELSTINGKLDTVGVEYTAGSGGVTKGDLLFISGNDTVSRYSNLANAENCIGIAAASASAGQSVKVLANDTKLAGVLSEATAGDSFYWTGSGFSVTMPSASGSHVFQVGIAKNASDLAVEVVRVKKNA